MMTTNDVITLVVSVIGVIIIPVLVYVVRITARWTSVEQKLTRVAADMEKLVRDKDVTHAAMIDTMSKDREATDRRLRWLENHLWAIIGPDKRGDSGG